MAEHPDVVRSLDAKQRRLANRIIRIGQRRRAGRKRINSALATGLVETRLRNLKYGDADSQGWRQERASLYPNPTNVKASINRYYDEAARFDRPGLSPGELAANVQRPASQYRGRYAEEMDEAKQIRRALTRNGSPGTRGTVVPGRTEVSLPKSTIPGQSFAAEREAAKRELLMGGDINMDRLLAYKSSINSLRDVPERTVRGDLQVRRTEGNPVRAQAAGVGSQRELKNTNRTLNEMFRIASDVDKINRKGGLPYKWGGGHGAKPADVGEPVDCSGFVSQVLGVSPRVSGQFAAGWGVPGRGKWVTVYANPTHVLMSMRDPRTKKVRWFGTSRSNPGGGAGEIAPPSKEYLSKFTARRPGGLK